MRRAVATACVLLVLSVPSALIGLSAAGAARADGTPPSSSAPPTPPTPLTLSADRFVDTIAVNTHVTYLDTAYADRAHVAAAIAWLGIRHARDAMPDTPEQMSAYAYLAKLGVQFDLIVRDDVSRSLHWLDELQTISPGSVTAVEGFNEIDHGHPRYAGLTGDAAGLAAQRAIYAHVHGDPRLAGIAVYDLTGYRMSEVATRAHAANYANQHVYPQNGEQPAYNANGDAWIGWALAGVAKFGLPTVLTEFGYFTLAQSGWNVIGVDEATQAKGILNGLLDAARLHVSRTYLYELLDEKADPHGKDSEMHFGLFHDDYSPKPAATAIHNLVSILRSTGAAPSNDAAAGRLDYALHGLPASGMSLLLQKDDGRFVLAVWNEVPFWNRASGTPIDSGKTPVQLDLRAAASRIDVYDPIASASPFATYKDRSRITVGVPDHPVLVEITLGEP